MASRCCQLFGQTTYRFLKPRAIVPLRTSSFGAKPLNMATIATYRVPRVENENNVGRQRHQSMYYIRLMPSFFQKHYAKGSPDRKALEDALHKFRQGTLEVPTVIDGKEVSIPESCTMSEDAIIPKILYAGGKAHKL